MVRFESARISVEHLGCCADKKKRLLWLRGGAWYKSYRFISWHESTLKWLEPLPWSPLVSEWELRSLLRLLTDSSAALQWFLQRLFPLSLCHPCSCRTPAPTWEIIPRLTAHLKKKNTSPLSLSVANSQRANPPAAAFYARTGGDDAAAASLLSPPPPRHSLRYRPVSVVTESSPHDQKCCRDLRVL